MNNETRIAELSRYLFLKDSIMTLATNYLSSPKFSLESEHYISDGFSVIDGFLWKGTPEGDDYWGPVNRLIINRLKHIEDLIYEIPGNLSEDDITAFENILFVPYLEDFNPGLNLNTVLTSLVDWKRVDELGLPIPFQFLEFSLHNKITLFDNSMNVIINNL